MHPAPFDIRLFGDDSVIVQPDLSVICRSELLTDLVIWRRDTGRSAGRADCACGCIGYKGFYKSQYCADSFQDTLLKSGFIFIKMTGNDYNNQ